MSRRPDGGFLQFPARLIGKADDMTSTGLCARVDRAIDRALEDRRIVGTVVLVARRGDIVYRRAAGFADREAGRSLEENDIFLLASITKTIASTSEATWPTVRFMVRLSAFWCCVW